MKRSRMGCRGIWKGAGQAQRHERIRAAMQSSAAAAELFARSGLAARPSPPGQGSQPNIALVASVAPPAPSARYAFDKPEGRHVRMLGGGRSRWGLAAGIGAGVAVGALISFIALTRAARHADVEAKGSTQALPPAALGAPAALGTSPAA